MVTGIDRGRREMLRLTSEAKEIVDELYNLRQSKWTLRLRSKEESIRRLLQKLAATGEVAAIPPVAGLLSTTDETTLQCVRGILGILFARLSANDLLHLYEHFGHAYYWQPSVDPSQVLAIAGDPDAEGHVQVLGLLTFHESGFVRHRAVRLLSNLECSGELPFLLLRQNDWVEPIARDARVAVSERINDENGQQVAESLEIILHLSSLRRYDHSETVRKAVDILLKDAHDSFLRRAVESEVRVVRREMVRLGLAIHGGHLHRLIPYGLKSDDAIVRLNCCCCLPLICSGDSLLEALNKIKEDRFMPIRREAIRLKAEHFPDSAQLTWQNALADQHSSIRELACWHVRNEFDSCPSHYYRFVLREYPDSLPALDGLSETGDETDAELFMQLLSHPQPSRRCIGIRGLIRVTKDSAVEIILPLLRDGSPRVVTAVCKGLSAFPSSLSEDELIEAAMQGKAHRGHRSIVELLTTLGKWRCLPALLKIVSEAASDTSEFAQRKIQDVCRYNRVFTGPSSEDRERIIRTIEKSRTSVPADTLCLVEQELKRFG